MLSPQTVPPEHRRLLEAFLSRRSQATREAYRQDMEAFARWCGTSLEHACSLVMLWGKLEASARVLEYLDEEGRRGLAPATLARRLNSIRGLVQLGRVLGICEWILEIPAPKVVKYRDTRGPGRKQVQEMVRAAAAQEDPRKAARDVAILRLLYDLALRKSEAVASLRFPEDLDLKSRTIWVRGKGAGGQRAPLRLPTETVRALAVWMDLRGAWEGPVFHRLDHGGVNVEDHQALTGRAVWDLVAGIGAGLGFRARPHGLRHSAITDALDAGHDLRNVQRFSRHADINTLLTYDDNRKDLGSEVSESLAKGVNL